MRLEDFCKKTKASISESRNLIGHKYMRNISVKTYFVYIDIRTMKPFSPKTQLDCLNCLTFRGESSLRAKEKAYEFLLENGHL